VFEHIYLRFLYSPLLFPKVRKNILTKTKNYGITVLLIRISRRSDGRAFRGDDLRIVCGLTTSLTIYGFGLRGNSATGSIGKHRFRTREPRKSPEINEKTIILRFGYWRPRVLRRLENIVVCHRLRKSAALHTRYFLRARRRKQLSTVSYSLTRHFDQSKKC
jgi:hypothetical protein